jgi:hypothetical protein
MGGDLGPQGRFGLGGNGAWPPGTGLCRHGAPIPAPLPPAAQRALADAKAVGDLSRPQPGILGCQQPFTEIGGVLLLHAPTLRDGYHFRNLR